MATVQHEPDIQTEYHIIHRQYRVAALVSLFVLGSGATFYHFTEHFSWVDAFYFCTITLTTIGYGDIVPKTAAGKMFTIFYALIGIGIIAYFVNLLVKNAVLRREHRASKGGQNESND